MDSRRIAVSGGVSLQVLTAGMDGPGGPVLLVHGLSSNAHLWDGVAEHLLTLGHPVAAVDQRGHGRSDKPADGYDFATLTVDLMRTVDALGWADSRLTVAGQSWGGNVVLELAARYPENLSAVVLVDGGTIELTSRFADWPSCQAALAPPPISGTKAFDFEKLIRTHHPDWPETGIRGTLANVEVLEDGTIRPWLSLDNHMTILGHMWEHRPSDVYPAVTVPTMLVMAEDPSNQRWMAGKRDEVGQAARKLEHSAVHWIDGDHDLHAQYPDRVAELIHRASRGELTPT
jgi:pimeloyl-ACP methyl ester carboxylesterase